MARYVCPVCGKNCNDLGTLNACIAQHIQTEEKQKKEKAKEIIELKQKTIRKKSDELSALIKEFNELPDNPYIVTYTPPVLAQKKKIKPIEKDTNTNTSKKDAGDKKEMDFDQMLDDLYGRAKKSSTFSKDEAEKFEKDLDDCLGALLGSLFRS